MHVRFGLMCPDIVIGLASVRVVVLAVNSNNDNLKGTSTSPGVSQNGGPDYTGSRPDISRGPLRIIWGYLEVHGYPIYLLLS